MPKTTLVDAHHDAGKTIHHLKSSAQNMLSDGQLLKSQVLCRVHQTL